MKYSGKEINPIISTLIKVWFILIVTLAVFTFIFGLHRYSGEDMFPMIKDGDLCVFYRLEEPYLEDVILYKENGKYHLGRVIAMGGQEVNFKNGILLVDGSIPNEYIEQETHIDETSTVKYPVILEKGEYFVLNDKRSNFEDSRKFGKIRKQDIEGKVKFIFRGRGV